MSEQPLISVIVPVYKVEPYLDRCVQSIVDQTYTNLEIILVDDGSPDNCPAMCDVWAEKDARIKVIHKENGGGAQARNVGIAAASGSHLAFVDSDDYVLPEMYDTLLKLLHVTEADISECGYHIVGTEDHLHFTSSAPSVQCFDAEQALLCNIQDRICRQLVWNKLYSRDVLHNVLFVEGKFIDDEFFTYRVLGQARKVAVTQQKFYCYRQQPTSAMHQAFSIKWLDAVDAKQQRVSYMAEKFPSLVSQARTNLWYTCLYMGQMALLHLSQNDKRIAFERLHSAQEHFPLTKQDKAALALKQRIWASMSQLSFKATCKLRNTLKIGI